MTKHLIAIISSILLLASSTNAQNWKSFYQRVTPIDDTTFIVKRFGKHGVVNTSGEVIIQAKYDTLITYPKGFVAEETINEKKTKFLLSKTGKTLYTPPSGTKFLPYDDPAWDNAANKIPLVKTISGVYDISDYRLILPYQYLYTLPMGINNSFFLVANEQEKWAVLDSSNQLKTEFIYTIESPKEDDKKSIIKSIDKKSIPEHFYNNWVYRNDTLVCLSSLTSKELWHSATPQHILCCDKGIHFVRPKGNYSTSPEYVIIDEVTQSVTSLDSKIEKVHTYLGNGLFYVSEKDGVNGTVDINGTFQKEYPYTEIRKIPKSGIISTLKPSNIDFGDYVYAMSEEGVFLWSPSTNHRMRIGEKTYSLEHYKLRPFSKSKRYWILMESEDFEYLERGTYKTPINFSKLIISDSASGEIVYSKQIYREKGGICLNESSPSNDTWVINHHSYHNDKAVSFFYKGEVIEYNNTYCIKLSPDGRFYKMESDNFSDSYSKKTRIFDTQKGKFVKYGIEDAIFFGNKGKEKFMIQEQSSYGAYESQFHFADLDLNKIKTLGGDIHDVDKIELIDNPENSLLEVSKKDANGDNLYGVIDTEGNQILPIKYGSIHHAYQKDGKYTFITRRISSSNFYGGLFISNTIKQSNCSTDWSSRIDNYIFMAVDSVHSCVFNLESGQVSQKFKRGYLIKHKGAVYITERGDDSQTTIYNASTFKPISPKPYQPSNRINPRVLIDFKTGKELTDWHYLAHHISGFSIIYKNIEQTINWDGNCIDGCD
jgi:hypothetical protein